MTLDFYFLLFLVRRRILLGRIITASILKSRHRKGDNSNMRKVVWHLMKIGMMKIDMNLHNVFFFHVYTISIYRKTFN